MATQIKTMKQKDFTTYTEFRKNISTYVRLWLIHMNRFNTSYEKKANNLLKVIILEVIDETLLLQINYRTGTFEDTSRIEIPFTFFYDPITYVQNDQIMHHSIIESHYKTLISQEKEEIDRKIKESIDMITTQLRIAE